MIVFSYIENGAQHTTTDLSLVWRGAWSQTTSYNQNDWVLLGNDFFVALMDIVPCASSPPPPPDQSSDWALLVMSPLSPAPGPSILKTGPMSVDWTNLQLIGAVTHNMGGTNTVSVNGTQVYSSQSYGTNLGILIVVYGSVTGTV